MEWCHMGGHTVAFHRRFDHLSKSLIRPTTKTQSNTCLLDLCALNSPHRVLVFQDTYGLCVGFAENVPYHDVIKYIILARLQISGNSSLHRTLGEYQKQYGDICSFYMGPHVAIVLSGSDVIRDAFVNKAKYFSARPSWFFLTKPMQHKKGILGTGWESVSISDKTSYFKGVAPNSFSTTASISAQARWLY